MFQHVSNISYLVDEHDREDRIIKPFSFAVMNTMTRV